MKSKWVSWNNQLHLNIEKFVLESGGMITTKTQINQSINPPINKSINQHITFLPTSLLCRFILFLILVDFSVLVDSGASTNCRLNSIPYLTLSLHPPHFQPSTVCSPSRALTSHVHVVKFPAVHACVTECTTPALRIEYINAVSLVPEIKQKKRS